MRRWLIVRRRRRKEFWTGKAVAKNEKTDWRPAREIYGKCSRRILAHPGDLRVDGFIALVSWPISDRAHWSCHGPTLQIAADDGGQVMDRIDDNQFVVSKATTHSTRLTHYEYSECPRLRTNKKKKKKQLAEKWI